LNLANRLIQVVTPNDTIAYAYDWSNRLIRKTVDGKATGFLYDGWTVVGKTNPAGRIQQTYVVGPGIDEVLGQHRAGQKLYLLRDGLNSTTAVTNVAGVRIQRYAYDVYGAVQVLDPQGHPTTDLPKTNYLFTGRELEPATGLYNYRNRFYHPGVGRFLQPDPIGFQGGEVNLYRYALNDPINLVDPSGLKSCTGVIDAPFGFDFSQACANHDRCCACTGNLLRCNLAFYDDLLAVCRRERNPVRRRLCEELALRYAALAVFCVQNESDCRDLGGCPD